MSSLRPYGDSEPAFSSGRFGVFGICQSSLSQPHGPSPPFDGGDSLCVADTRLDNRDELASRFNISANASDSEIILRAWQYREKAFGLLRGDYAFALGSNANRTIHLVRGPSGERPLYFAILFGVVHFASMPWALITQPQLWRGWNLVALAAALLKPGRPEASSYYSGIDHVLPGEAITIADGVVARRRRWAPDPPELEANGFDNAVTAYRALLDNSVRARLARPLGRVASQLSSGWDSSAVAATAARLLDLADKPLIAITSAPTTAFKEHPASRQTFDESKLAARTAAFNGIEHHVVRPNRSILPQLRAYVRRYQQPLRNFVNSSWWDASLELARDHGASILLTGESGNLTINRGHRDEFGELLRAGHWIRWSTEARAALSIRELRWTGIAYHSFSHLFPESLSQWMLKWRLQGANVEEGQLVLPAFVQRAHDWVKGQSPGHKRMSSRDQAIEVILQGDCGNDRKGNLAAFGVDVRDPTSDERGINFGYALSSSMLISGGELRPLARRALSDRLPPEVLANRRRGAQGADWFHTILRDDAKAIFDEISANATVNGLLDLSKIRRLIDDWPTFDDGSFRLAQLYAKRLPEALATGLFVIEVEQIAGKGLLLQS